MMHEEIFREEVRAAIGQIDFSKVSRLAELQQRVTLSEKEVSELYGWSTRLLQEWRTKGIGPRYIKGAMKVTYRRSDLDAYVSAQAVKTRDQQ